MKTLLLFAIGIAFAVHVSGIHGADDLVPHVNSCNFCSKCIVDDESLDVVADVSGAVQQPTEAGVSRYASLLQPPDVEAKAQLPNCTVCRGCNVDLRDISGQHVKFQNVHFVHGKGATNGRIFFLESPRSKKRYIVKVFCIPISKIRQHSNRPATCSVKQASERVEILLAQQKLLQDCGMQEITPRVWLAKINAVLPESGFHVNWHGLMMEEAHGITLHALAASREYKLALQLLQHKLNRTQVKLGAIWDLLTAQCDRHAENIFIDENGNLQFIDNDKALGVVSKCGFDTMLIPGTRYHSVLRVGFWRHLADHYRSQRLKNPNLCHGLIDSRFVIDYRCTTPTGKLGTDFPPAFNKCLAKLSAMSVDDIMKEYGLSSPARAEVLKFRSTDMLSQGFEWTMESGQPLNSPRFKNPHQPPCCGLQVYSRMLTCDKCWQPLLPEDFTNSTDLSLVTSLVDRGPRVSRTRVQYTQVTRTTFTTAP